MSHLSILSAPLPHINKSKDDAYFVASSSHASSSKLTVPDSFLRPSRSRSNSILKKQCGSLPGSPVASSFPQRPGFRRAATTTAVSTISTTTESSRFDELHYSQTHFSRSTLLVYPDSEVTQQASGEVGAEEDIRELLLASSDEESSAPPSTPGIDSSRIPPRGSSVSIVRTAKQSMDSEKSALLLPEPIQLLAPPATQENRRTGYVTRSALFLNGYQSSDGF